MLRRTFAKAAFSLFTGTALGRRLVKPEPTRLFPFDFGLVVSGVRHSIPPEVFTIDFRRMRVHITIQHLVTTAMVGTVTHAYLDKLDTFKLHEYDLLSGDTVCCTLIFDLKTKKFCDDIDFTRYYRSRPQWTSGCG